MRNRTKAALGGALLFAAGIGLGTSISSSPTTPAAAGTTRTVDVPGPTITVTAQPAAPAPSTALGRWSGNGTSSKVSFAAPASGDYVVSWRFSGNTTGYGGDNFIMNDTDSNADSFSLPNVIQESGSGSTEVTGASGTEVLNVQADQGCHWVVKVVAAS